MSPHSAVPKKPEVTSLTTKRFEAKVESAGNRLYIAIPFDPDEAWGVKERHHVGGTVNDLPIRNWLDPVGTRLALVLGAAWNREHGLKEGDDVQVVLAPWGPQVDGLSPDMAAALNADPEAKAFFEALAPFYRRNYVRWIESAKQAATRGRRIAQMIDLLKAGVKQR
jgi:hypothetical protein